MRTQICLPRARTVTSNNAHSHPVMAVFRRVSFASSARFLRLLPSLSARALRCALCLLSTVDCRDLHRAKKRRYGRLLLNSLAVAAQAGGGQATRAARASAAATANNASAQQNAAKEPTLETSKTAAPGLLYALSGLCSIALVLGFSFCNIDLRLQA